jgi:hypothetical protein
MVTDPRGWIYKNLENIWKTIEQWKRLASSLLFGFLVQVIKETCFFEYCKKLLLWHLVIDSRVHEGICNSKKSFHQICGLHFKPKKM